MKYLKNTSQLNLDQKKCIGCGRCAEVCPHAVFVMQADTASITDKDLCMECGACQRNCPADAIQVRSGVGCAAAVISGKLKGTEPLCGCSDTGGCC